MTGFAPGITESAMQSTETVLMRGPASGRRLIRSLRCFNSSGGSQTAEISLVSPAGRHVRWVDEAITAGDTFATEVTQVLLPGWSVVGRTVSVSAVHDPLQTTIVWADHN